ncbi:MAG: hypothetical protein HY930_05915 [Euryarchaeota archaeon]|nr:hypothetical protein [Euryarchaeota archaeon]
MSTKIAVELERAEVEYLINHLLGELHIWSDKGMESKSEESEFKQIALITNKLREAVGDEDIIIL